MRGDDENSAGASLAAVDPLNLASGAGLAVTILRHERKAQGQVGSSGRGSNAVTGAVDTVISIRRREGGGRDTVRVLTAVSRFDGVPAELWVQLTADGYEEIQPGAIALDQAKRAILNHAPAVEAEAVPEQELFRLAGVSRSTGQRARDALLGNELKRVGGGKRNDPYRYFRFCPNPIPREGQKEAGLQ